jgi:hypothetical protein
MKREGLQYFAAAEDRRSWQPWQQPRFGPPLFPPRDSSITASRGLDMPVAILTIFHAMGRGDTDDRFIVGLRIEPLSPIQQARRIPPIADQTRIRLLYCRTPDCSAIRKAWVNSSSSYVMCGLWAEEILVSPVMALRDALI